jgi:hypothetical protein
VDLAFNCLRDLRRAESVGSVLRVGGGVGGQTNFILQKENKHIYMHSATTQKFPAAEGRMEGRRFHGRFLLSAGTSPRRAP